MKKISLFLFFMLAMFLVVTVACNKEEEATTYTVSFVTGTTENIANQTVKENEKVVKPTDPKKDGADFLGWYVGDTEYDFNKGVTSNLTLTAKWDAYFTVTFNTGTDVTIDSQKVKTDGKAVKPADPEKVDYVFVGWYIEEAQYDFEAVVTKDLELTAKWEEAYLQKTVEEIIAAEDGKYIAEGVVAGVNAESFLLKDDTGAILVYLGYGYAKDLELGDKVKVKGATSSYGLAKQFGIGTEYEKVEAGTVSHGNAKELSVKQINDYASAASVAPLYVRLVGELEVSGKYYNLKIAGADVVGSLTYPVDSDELVELDGVYNRLYQTQFKGLET